MLEVFTEFDGISADELHAKLFEIDDLIVHLDSNIKEEDNKFNRYKVENERRQHNYIPLIFELLKNMSEKNVLEEIYEEARKETEEKK